MSAPVGTGTEVTDYAGRVRAALADLPAADRDDLVAELEDHLAEVAAEGPLEELLGAPEAYAAELRSSAGLPPRAGDRRPQEALRNVTDRPWVRATLDFLPELRPGWWVLRGLLLAAIAGLALGTAVLAVLLALVLVPASVVLGRRARTDRRLRWAGVAISATAVVVLLVLLDVAATSSQQSSPEPYPVDTSGLSGVTNFYPYSKDGTPLTDVQLFDQDGNPVELRTDTDSAGNVLTRVARDTADGLVVGNVYPQRQTTTDYAVDGTTRQRAVVPPAVRAPVLTPR